MKQPAWRNWAGNVTAVPDRIACPGSVDELAQIVGDAAERGGRVKAVGSAHSFSPIALTSGSLIDLRRLNQPLTVDHDTGLVTVQAGMPLHRLNAFLSGHGLGLTNMGDVDRQTVAGAISTGTHGTGRRSGPLATQVAALELVLADGSVVRCSPGERPDLFDVARVGLGALGVITAVTFRTEPAFLLHADERAESLEAVLDGLTELVATNDHVDLYWWPHTDTVQVKRNNRVPGPRQPLSPVRRVLEDEVLSNAVFSLSCRLARRVPRVVPAINRVAANLRPRSYTDHAPDVFTSPRRVHFRETEWAVPRAALPDVLRELRTLPERLGIRVSFPVEIRVSPGDDVPLSTAYGRDTAYVSAHSYVGTPHVQWFAAVSRLARQYDGRPHWGKEHDLGRAELEPLYPRFADVVALRDRLDPGGVFRNDYLDRVLGPPATSP